MKYFNIKSSERFPVSLLMLMFFCVVGASITGSSVRDTFFLTQFDKSLLPLMFAAVSIVMVISISLYNRIASSIDIVNVIIATSIIFSASLYLILSNLVGIIIPILYVWIDVIISITILQFWLLASEIFNPRQAKRLFGLIGTGGSIAGISSGYLIRPFVKQFGAENLIIPTIGLIILMALISVLLKPYQNIRYNSNNNKSIDNENINKVSQSHFDPYIKTILFMVCAAAICSRIVEYQFKITAVTNYPDTEMLASFFGDYYMMLNGLTLFMQFFLTGYILNRFGIIVGLIFLPLGLAMGAFAFFALASLSSIVFSRLIDQAFKFSIQSASNEILWTPVHNQKRRQLKPLIDSSYKSIAEGLIGVFIYFITMYNILSYDQIYFLSIPLIIITCIWIWNNFRIKKGYIKTLESAIEHRHLNLSSFEFDTTDSHIVETIESALNDENDNKKSFALELIKDLPLHKWIKSIHNLLQNGNPEIQKQILILATDRQELINKKIIYNLSLGDTEIAARALVLNEDNVLLNIKNKMASNLTHKNVHIRSASAICLLKIKQHMTEANSVLNDILDIKDQKSTAIALDYLKNSGDLLSKDDLISLLYHPSKDISLSSLDVAANRLDKFYIPAIISNLENPKTVKKARETLNLFNQEEVLINLKTELKKENIPINLVKGIVKCLSIYSSKDAINILRSMLYSNLDISIEVSNALMKISKTKTISVEFKKPFIKEIIYLSDEYRKLHYGWKVFSKIENNTLILDQINTDKKKLVYIILKLISLKIPDSPVESHIKKIINNKDQDLPFILEFFDSTFEREIKDLIIPIIDPETSITITDKEELAFGYNELIKLWSESNNDWKSAIAVNFLLNGYKNNNVDIDWGKIAPSPLLAEIFNKIPSEQIDIPINKFKNKMEPNMYSVIEKTIILKTVDLFQDIPGELLSKISQISKAKHYPAKETVFKEGDSGNSMYIVIEGTVSIKKSNKLLADLEKGSSLGEMALLDHETRSADAIAKTDSVLLKINQDIFFELMESNADIMKQIIKLLTSRIRKANLKLEKTLQ